jgi:ribosomal protein S18 acetylase RimI-like enzyme
VVPAATHQAVSEAAVEAYLRRAPYLHAYELGDLDPREAPHTTWLASPAIDAVALIYRGLATPTLVGLAHGDPAALRALLAARIAELPARFYAHLTPGMEDALAEHHRVERIGHNRKMALVAPLAGPEDRGVIRLGPEHADEVARFYRASYPDGYFEPVNLVRGPYLALRDPDGIAAVAGVHVYSPAKRVAALGNIATRPDARGRGHAQRVTAALCRLLERECDVIGLNVRAENAAAIACYQRVGFELRDAYGEWIATRR